MKYYGMGELFILLHNCMLVARHGDTNAILLVESSGNSFYSDGSSTIG
jgi:hypothetical protein